MSGTIVVISAPSGAGKTSIVKALCDQNDSMRRAVSYTTRAQREREVDGRDYHFISQAAFEALVDANGFLEHARVFGHEYGTPRKEVLQQLEQGYDVLVDIDWQGAALIKEQWPDVLTIFVLPPSLQALEDRLTARGQDGPKIIQKRMAQAQAEMVHHVDYDYLILNSSFEQAVAECASIIYAHKFSCVQQQKRLAGVLKALLAHDA
jgi:guanylate kinase